MTTKAQGFTKRFREGNLLKVAHDLSKERGSFQIPNRKRQKLPIPDGQRPDRDHAVAVAGSTALRRCASLFRRSICCKFQQHRFCGRSDDWARPRWHAVWELSSRPLPAPDSFWCETGAVRAPSLYEIIVRSRGLYSLSLNRNWLIGLRETSFS